jgi:hypothetical protein
LQADSFSTKATQELLLLGDGIATGFKDRAHDVLTHPGLTALEIGTAAAVGAGMKLMTSAGGRWGVAAKVSGLFLGIAAAFDYPLMVGAGALGSLSTNLIADSLKPTPPPHTGDPPAPPAKPQKVECTRAELENLWYLIAGNGNPPEYFLKNAKN